MDDEHSVQVPSMTAPENAAEAQWFVDGFKQTSTFFWDDKTTLLSRLF